LRIGEKGNEDGGRQDGDGRLQKIGIATGTAPLVTTLARLFGLDAGDWAMILLGLALSGLLLALA